MHRSFKTLLAISCIVPLSGFSQQLNFQLSGKIARFSAPAKAYLVYRSQGQLHMDSTLLKNGTFSFKGIIPAPVGATLLVDPKGNGLSTGLERLTLYLESGAIVVNAPVSLSHGSVVGGPVNTDNGRLQQMLAATNAQLAKINTEYENAGPEQKKSKSFNEHMDRKSDSIAILQKTIYHQFIVANPNSVISFFSLKNYAGPIPDVNETEALFNSLSTTVRTSPEAKIYSAELMELKRTSVGSMAPDFTQVDSANKPVSLHDFRGKYVLVDFWASWCLPCRAENPNIVKAYERFHQKGFEILGVSLDEQSSRQAWIKAISDDHLSWTQVSDLKGWRNEVAVQYSVRAIPQNVLIAPDGKIVARNVAGETLTRKLAELLGSAN